MPIYKKGDIENPENHRPIALLSHARKAVEGGIYIKIRKQYTFSDTQLGFQIETGTETEIVRQVAEAETKPNTAILDLKGAYGAVTRDKLMDVIRGRLPEWLARIIAMTLQELIVTTTHESAAAKVTPNVAVFPAGNV